MFTKHTKIVQLVLLYCVVAQSYVVPESRSLAEEAKFFQDLCNDRIDEGEEGGRKFEINILSYLRLSYNWGSTISYHPNTRGKRSLNEHPLKNQSSVPIKKHDNRIEDQRITANEIIEHTKWIITEVKKLQKIAKDAVINSSQNFSKNADESILWFVIMVHQWTSDAMILNIIGKSYYEKILEFPQRCISPPETNYTLQDRIVKSTDILSIIKKIQNELRANSNELFGEKSNDTMKRNSRTAELLEKLIKSIVTGLTEKLDSKETVISSRLNNDIFNLQLIAYKWILNIRYPNISKKSTEKSRPPLEGQFSFPMEKNDNGPTDQEKNTTDVMERKGRTIDAFNKPVCKFKRTIRQSIEMKLFTYNIIIYEWFYNEYGLNIANSKSINDFQLRLDKQSFSLPMKESELEDEEITIKDFMDNVKLTKRQLNENLKVSEETTTGTDNDFSKKLWNVEDHTHVKRSNPDPLENLNLLRLKFKLTIYRWISNIVIYNTIDLTPLGDSDLYPGLRECQLMFPIKKTKDQLTEFEVMSNEIISLTNKLLQISADEGV
ncbi:uncharacterized protein [Mycetomoellerius zeteki]|uniref:uncharacterized protein n=1 Tax=Mycetomoellerius zeteki TaxID=64791 RepID=UPI00084EA72D|nr:PREDICTED: uncharacterized protein LOC108723684 [Trachymyrmex zeteki]